MDINLYMAYEKRWQSIIWYFALKNDVLWSMNANFSRKKKIMNTCIEIFNKDCPVDYLPNIRE